MRRSTKSLMSGLRRRGAPKTPGNAFARGLAHDIHRNERKRIGSKAHRSKIKKLSGFGRFS